MRPLGVEDIPYLPSGVRLHHDRVRGADVLLAPEVALMLDEIGLAILSRVDGRRSLAEIVRDLAETYDAPAEEIAGDVRVFLDRLRARLHVMVRP